MNTALMSCRALYNRLEFRELDVSPGKTDVRLEDLTVLKRSPDLLDNVKIGQDQLQLIMKNILFYGGYSHFG